MRAPEPREARVLVLAPIGRDAQTCAELLARVGVHSTLCADATELTASLGPQVAAVLVAEEALYGKNLTRLSQWIAEQPTWSDLPFVVLTSHVNYSGIALWRRQLVAALRNVSLLERPVQTITLTSTVQAAVRARLQQHEVRALLEAQARAALHLEYQVHARTRELQAANEALRAEMTERARIEESLRQSQRLEAVGQLTGGVAHDFNNLLMVILGGLQMLERQDQPGRRRVLMDGMRQAAQRGASLTRQLLAFSRRQTLQPQPIDLARQIGGMRELLDRSLREDVHIELKIAPDVWPVHADPGELELVVLNLAVNARDAMPRGGAIVISAENLPALNGPELCGDYVRLSIADCGEGMTPQVQARVFEPFFTTKESGKGSGLGLAQVYGFSKQSGGSVEIASQLGRGTTVSLVLPRAVMRPAPGAEPDDSGRQRCIPKIAGAVLLVEDNDAVAKLVSEMLDELGYSVIRAASAAAALSILDEGRAIDVVFSDIMMPGDMDGVELAEEIRARRSRVPVLLTSGFTDAAARRAEAGGFPVLPKPYQLEDLAAALKTTIESFGRSKNSVAEAAARAH